VISNYEDFLFESYSDYYKKQLAPGIWERGRGKNKTWKLDPLIRRKLMKIADEFIEQNSYVIKKSNVEDIQLIGSICSYNWNEKSDIDLHIILDYSEMKGDEDLIQSAMWGIKFEWNTDHDIKIKGFDVEIYVENIGSIKHTSAIYSVKNNEWVKEPVYSPPKIDEEEIRKKYNDLSFAINKLENKLVLATIIPTNSRNLYNLAKRLIKKITKMRKDSLKKGGEFSPGNLAFKKLRSEGYIAKLFNIVHKSYDKIYNT